MYEKIPKCTQEEHTYSKILFFIYSIGKLSKSLKITVSVRPAHKQWNSSPEEDKYLAIFTKITEAFAL